MKTSNIILLIPAYKPGHNLVSLVNAIARLDRENILSEIVVIDDGSGNEFNGVFNEIAKLDRVTVLQHAINLGKGAALKTGFNYVLVHSPQLNAVVTADADGQHTPEDIINVTRESAKNPGALILGARVFGKDIPFRSLMGNQLTRTVMQLFTGLKLSDTQTGLRAWPRKLCMHSLKITINGYDFEMESLIRARQWFSGGLRLVEVPIKTIYEEGNKSSHFNPLLDSMRIYFVFVRYCGASIATALVDYLFFTTAYIYLNNIGASMVIGRTFALAISFYLNRTVVFHDNKRRWYSFLKFIATVVVFGFISFFTINYLHNRFGFNVVAAKAVIELLLFFVGFAVMNLFIFNHENAAAQDVKIEPKSYF
jgi:glycosyltransferase involved in cell wall biosynthesis